MAKGKYARKRLLKQLRTRPINESGLSEWIIKALTKAEINTMADLFTCNEEKLKAVPGIGTKAMEELHELLKKLK